MCEFNPKLLIVCTFVLLFGGASAALGGDYIDPGIDGWTSPGAEMALGGSSDLPPVPADFFGPGSDPFDGIIYFEGQPVPPDTLIQRLTTGHVPPPYPSSDVIDTEIVELNLVSTSPITVTSNGGQDPTQWDVDVQLSVTPAPVGSLTAVKTHENGGTFTTDLYVQPVFTFTSIDNPGEVRILDTGLEGISPLEFVTVDPYPWECSVDEDDFYPSGVEPMVLSAGPSGQISLNPAEEQICWDDFYWVVFPGEWPEGGGGTGYNDGEWYPYVNTGWWNQWFWNGPYDPERIKWVDIYQFVLPWEPFYPGYIEIAINWTTPAWDEQGLGRPPLPEDVPTIEIENMYIERHYCGAWEIGELGEWIEYYFDILDYNPEWVSIDVRGYNFVILEDALGYISHCCLSPPEPKPLIEHSKWSQPPIEIDATSATPTYSGWNEISCLSIIGTGSVKVYENYDPLGLGYFFAPGTNLLADDIDLAGTERILDHYDFTAYAHNGTAPYTVTSELYTDNAGAPGTPIPGTYCVHQVTVDGPVVLDCAPGSGVVLPDNVWMVLSFSAGTAGWGIGDVAEIGSTDDDFAQYNGVTWSHYSFGGNPHAGFEANIWCRTEEGVGAQQLVADDFRCIGNMPVTSIHWWGSHYGWEEPGITPPQLPIAWRIGFWSNVPANPFGDPEYSYPEMLLWQIDIDASRVEVNEVGTDYYHEYYPNDICYQYNVDLEPNEWFWQNTVTDLTQDNVYWLSIAAVYEPHMPEPPIYPWGWKTRPWSWMDDAVRIQHYGPLEEGIVLDPFFIEPIKDPLYQESFDVAFELDTDPNYIKWEQYYTGIRHWPHYEDVPSMAIATAIVEPPFIDVNYLVADDWLCERETPVTAAVWWGSYIGYRFKPCHGPFMELPIPPDYFLLSIWDDVPAGADPYVPFSHPNDVIWQYRAYDYDEVLVGYDKHPHGNLDVVICGAPSVLSWNNDVQAKLMATGQFNTVDIMNVNAFTPTLAQLQAYDAALVYSDAIYADETALGNVMANYVDSGGGVVCMMFEIGYGSGPLPHPTAQMRGRWDTQVYYAVPRAGQFGPPPATLGTVHDPTHPIMQGVSNFDGGTYSARPLGTTLTPGSTLVAEWSDGRPLVVTKTIGGVPRVDLGFYPPSSDTRSDFWVSSTDGALLMANALTWVAGGGGGGPPSGRREPVFRYSVRLPEPNWFYQEDVNNVYWFSAVAVYDPNIPNYDWGWTNHEHVFNDDAVTGYWEYTDLIDLERVWRWEELYDQTGMSADMSFVLFTEPNFTEPDCFPICHPDYSEWVSVGKPDCWCYPRQCHGDADDLKEGSAKKGYYYVHFADLNVLLAGWNTKEPPNGPGIATITGPNGEPGICADFGHDQEGSAKKGYYRVHFSDLNTLIANWNTKEPPQGPGIDPNCLDCP